MLGGVMDRVALAVLPRIVQFYLKFTVLTSSISVRGTVHADRLAASGEGFIYAFWHNRQILLPVLRRDERIHCLISSSRDGEYVARVAAFFGKPSIRGSTTRGGFEAVKQIMRVLEEGGIVAITPDGPLGPAGRVQPGVVQISRARGAPVIPVAFDASRKKVFASWDRFIVPLPFSRIAVVFGEPIRFGQSESVEVGSARLTRALDAAVTDCARLLSERGRLRES
jgi:lysophospholipid acyltransferase (LPLAT)-like uncharacterized protein